MSFLKKSRPWNKGLTKETDIRIRLQSERQTGKKRLNFVPWNKGLGREDKICQQCGNSYPGYHSGKKFCSTLCYMKARTGTYHHSIKTKGKIAKGNIGKIVSEKTRKLQSIAQQGRPSWCKGLTIKTSKILREKVNRAKANGSNLNRRHLSPGEYHHTQKTKMKMSEIRSIKIMKGETSNGNKNGWYFSTKLNRNIRYLSSWEERAFILLDKNPEVVSFNPSPFRVSYLFKGEERFYIPDIKIEVGSQSTVIELKPDCFKNYPINQAKFKAARSFCDKTNLNFKIFNIDEFEQAYA